MAIIIVCELVFIESIRKFTIKGNTIAASQIPILTNKEDDLESMSEGSLTQSSENPLITSAMPFTTPIAPILIPQNDPIFKRAMDGKKFGFRNNFSNCMLFIKTERIIMIRGVCNSEHVMIRRLNMADPFQECDSIPFRSEIENFPHEIIVIIATLITPSG